MDKEAFNSLSIDKQIEYFNKELLKGNTLTGICKLIGIGRSTVSDRFKKKDYKFNKDTNQYQIVKNNDSSTVVIEEKNSKDLVNKPVYDTVSEIINISNEDVKRNLLELAKNYEIIQSIINDYKCNTAVIKEQITIDLPESENKLITLRINKKVLEIFDEFASKNNQFKKVDLISQSLLDFVNRYK